MTVPNFVTYMVSLRISVPSFVTYMEDIGNTRKKTFECEYEYVKGSGPRDPDAPKPYKLALCSPCPIKGAPKHY